MLSLSLVLVSKFKANAFFFLLESDMSLIIKNFSSFFDS